MLTAQKCSRPSTPILIRLVPTLPVALQKQGAQMPPDAPMCLVRFPTLAIQELAFVVLFLLLAAFPILTLFQLVHRLPEYWLVSTPTAQQRTMQ